jgi:5-methylcytosine-specific restriction endonuclease McrA
MQSALKSCEWCKGSFQERRYKQKYCSYVCGYSAKNYNRKQLTGPKPRKVNQCLRCGAAMEHKKSHALYCSKTCKSMDHNFMHRGGTRLSKARRQRIIDRDKATCYSCGSKLQISDIELDHLIPVSKGGTSDAQNVAVSCVKCNRQRGNKIMLIQLKKLAELGAIA